MPRRKKVVLPPEMIEENTIATPSIEVVENTSAPPSLKERILGNFEKKPEPKGRPSKKAGQNELIAKALPTVFTTFVVTISRNLMPEKYKALCPTKEEVEAVLFPLFSIMSRRIKVSLTATQDTIDVVSMIVASLTYGTRALITLELIEKEQKNGRSDIPQETDRVIRDTIDKASFDSSTTDTRDGDKDDTKGEAELFSELFRRDFEGRKQMGLVSRGIL
jgi:hypothetical protein